MFCVLFGMGGFWSTRVELYLLSLLGGVLTTHVKMH